VDLWVDTDVSEEHTVSIKMTVFWDIAPCSLVEIDVSEVFTANRPDDEDSKYL
jgi:hypothetical protein